jgi:hypothetical protein
VKYTREAPPDLLDPLAPLPRSTLGSVPRVYPEIGPFGVDLSHILLLISGPRKSEDHFHDTIIVPNNIILEGNIVL